MHHGSKCKGCNQKCKGDGQRYGLAKLVEERQATEQQPDAAADGGHVAAEDAYAHLPIGLPHLTGPCLFSRMDIFCREVDDVIHREADEDNDGNGFDDAKLLTVELE